jgi:hypothetical protein
LVLDAPLTAEQAFQAIRIRRLIAFVHMHDGRFAETTSWLERAMDLCRISGVPDVTRVNLRALLGIVALRRGEVDNCIGCLGPSSCILPIAPGAVHTRPAGSREAVAHFHAYLQEQPGDLRVRWLLNLAHMTLGEYPDKRAATYRVLHQPPLPGPRAGTIPMRAVGN